jgi:hypothetical protein
VVPGSHDFERKLSMIQLPSVPGLPPGPASIPYPGDGDCELLNYVRFLVFAVVGEQTGDRCLERDNYLLGCSETFWFREAIR